MSALWRGLWAVCWCGAGVCEGERERERERALAGAVARMGAWRISIFGGLAEGCALLCASWVWLAGIEAAGKGMELRVVGTWGLEWWISRPCVERLLALGDMNTGYRSSSGSGKSIAFPFI